MKQANELKVGKSTITKLSLNDHEHSPDSVLKSWLKSNFFFIEENQFQQNNAKIKQVTKLILIISAWE